LVKRHDRLPGPCPSIRPRRSGRVQRALATPSASPTPARCARSVLVAIPMTTPWPSPSSVFTRPSSSGSKLPLHLLLVPGQRSWTPAQDPEVEQPLAQQRAEQSWADGAATINCFGVIDSCCLFMAERSYAKTPRNCPRAPDGRSSGWRKEQRISRFVHSSPTPWRLPGSSFQGPPKTPKPAFFEAGLEFRLRSHPPVRKSSANLLTEPA